MGTLSTPAEIKSFLRDAKSLIPRRRRTFLPREKNLRSLSDLQLTVGEMWNEIAALTADHYISGPEPDLDPQRAGPNWWVFGKNVDGVDVYIKIGIHRDAVVCLSFHRAAYPLSFPYYEHE